MSREDTGLGEGLISYISRVGYRDTDIRRRLREETGQLAAANMQISANQGAFMSVLVKALGAKHCLEIGTFTGYSALCVAGALPPDGRLICCDVSEEWTTIAKRYWREAGVIEKIDLRIARALDTLDALIANGGSGQFDFVFIDADKGNYDAYYERALTLLRAGGLVAVDNVLWDGAVIDDCVQDEDTIAIRRLNEKIASDARVDQVLVPIGDGLTLAYKL
ncbi:MAG: class I SAM-dependent methyltransferase [Pseudomonadota bacterium]